ncbi:carboxypeptidase-like regulatory domain-containing protein [Terriglobus sp. YAF25]|uniref:carboxypeptidase-like regulatory domain-containing protein n=1 Tax=Terriglobus sp. YAF25 TaxID=3233080 RepID=UPI003F977564
MVTLLCLCLPCYAQFSSNVQGTVTDSSGAVIPKAAITLHNVQTGIDLRVATNATGYYRFTSVAPGNYEVAATEAGFTPGSVSVTVSPGETRGVDITLVPGSTTVSSP